MASTAVATVIASAVASLLLKPRSNSSDAVSAGGPPDRKHVTGGREPSRGQAIMHGAEPRVEEHQSDSRVGLRITCAPARPKVAMIYPTSLARRHSQPATAPSPAKPSSVESNQPSRGPRPVAVIDGANIARCGQCDRDAVSAVGWLSALTATLCPLGYVPVVIGDAGLRSTTGLHQHELAHLGAEVHYAQGAAEPHVLSATASRPDAVVVSSHCYREYRAAYPSLSTRPVTFMAIEGNAVVLIREDGAPLAPAMAIGQATQ